MKITPTALPGVLVIEPSVFSDDRGFFFESWNARALAESGIDAAFVQDNHSRSRRGVLRGLHYQVRRPQGKLVRTVVGEAYDVAVDLRRSSPAFGRAVGVTLSAKSLRQADLPDFVLSALKTWNLRPSRLALEITDTLVRSGAIDVLVVDSVAALVPRSELEGEMGDVQPGSQARLMSQALRKLTSSISRSRTMVVFINQIRMKIGVMYGSPETTSGGNALKFYASVRLDIRRIGAIKDRDEVVGNQTRVKVVKNKLAPPFKQVEFDIMYGEGVSKLGELIDLGVKAGVVEKSGAWYSYDSQRIGQGRENAKQFLKENPDLANRIEAQVRQNSGLIAEAILQGEVEKDDDDDGEAAAEA